MLQLEGAKSANSMTMNTVDILVLVVVGQHNNQMKHKDDGGTPDDVGRLRQQQGTEARRHKRNVSKSNREFSLENVTSEWQGDRWQCHLPRHRTESSPSNNGRNRRMGRRMIASGGMSRGLQ
jgi:hypothetical protein